MFGLVQFIPVRAGIIALMTKYTCTVVLTVSVCRFVLIDEPENQVDRG